MSLFGRRDKSPDFDKLFRTRDYAKLIRHLAHEDTEIAEKAKEVLRDLAADDEASQERERLWRAEVYDSVLNELEDESLSGRKSGLEESIRKMGQERDVKRGREDALETLFKEHSFPSPKGILLDELFKILEPDEELEFVQSLGIGEHWLSTMQGILITNMKAIYFDVSAYAKVTHLEYAKVKSAKQGWVYTKIIAEDGATLKPPNELEAMSYIRKYVTIEE